MYEADFLCDENVFGCIVLSNAGCGITNLLIVSGPEAGSVWWEDRCNDGGLCPLALHDPQPDFGASDGPRIGFLDWYNHWLGRSLQLLD